MGFMSKRSVRMDYVLILIGTALMALAINSIFDPINLVTGGFTGAAIIIKGMTSGIVSDGIPIWLTNLVLNIPVFLVAMKVKGIRFLKKTLFATVALSGWLYILPIFPIVTDDFLLAAVFGGAISGVGIGMVFMARATTGGTDLVAAIVQHYLRHYSIAQVMQVIDAIVVVIGFFVFGINKTLYAVIAIFVVARVSDGLIEGLKFSKIAYIITKEHTKVAAAIMDNIKRGVTGLDARGMFSGEHKEMLFCVVSKKEIVILKELVMEIDSNAFVIVTDAREVLGEGFIEEKLH